MAKLTRAEAELLSLLQHASERQDGDSPWIALQPGEAAAARGLARKGYIASLHEKEARLLALGGGREPAVREKDADPIPDAAALADELERIQAPKNGGFGVQLARDLAVFLRRGDVSMATGVARYNHDKLFCYPDLEEIVTKRILNTSKDCETRRAIWGDAWGRSVLSPLPRDA